MVNYTVEWRNGEYVRVPKRPAMRVVPMSELDSTVRGSSWRVWGKPRKGADRGRVSLQDWHRSTR